jgi:AcrR family transcriptional regulator
MAVEAGSDVSQRVMRAAKQLFFAKGFAKTSLRAIANEAGTSESGVLRLYHSKNGLVRAVYASCYAEINDHVEAALARAALDDPDPRHLLIEVARTVLNGYQADPQMNAFLLSHFGFRDSMGLGPEEGVDPAIDREVKQEYHRYLDRIHELSQAVTTNRPGLAGTGVTRVALAEIFTSIIYGIQTSWIMAEEEQDPTRPRVTVDEAVAAMRFFLYPETVSSQRVPEEV